MTNPQTPTEPGLDRPDVPGVWTRTEGDWELIVWKSVCNVLMYAGRCAGKMRWSTDVKYLDARGGWLAATPAPEAVARVRKSLEVLDGYFERGQDGWAAVQILRQHFSPPAPEGELPSVVVGGSGVTLPKVGPTHAWLSFAKEPQNIPWVWDGVLMESYHGFGKTEANHLYVKVPIEWADPDCRQHVSPAAPAAAVSTASTITGHPDDWPSAPAQEEGQSELTRLRDDACDFQVQLACALDILDVDKEAPSRSELLEAANRRHKELMQLREQLAAAEKQVEKTRGLLVRCCSFVADAELSGEILSALAVGNDGARQTVEEKGAEA